MGECDPPFNLEEWIPSNFDIIAIGVEECMSGLCSMGVINRVPGS